MPKTKQRKRTTQSTAAGRAAVQERVAPVASTRRSGRRVGYANGASLQSVTFAAMITCGFLGMAIFFAFFYHEDTNHFVYAGIAALTAVGWLFLLARRWSQYRRPA